MIKRELQAALIVNLEGDTSWPSQNLNISHKLILFNYISMPEIRSGFWIVWSKLKKYMIPM